MRALHISHTADVLNWAVAVLEDLAWATGAVCAWAPGEKLKTESSGRARRNFISKKRMNGWVVVATTKLRPKKVEKIGAARGRYSMR